MGPVMPEGRQWIKELRPGCDVEETYAVRSKDLRQRRGGGGFLALTLGDRTGQIAALVWENVENLARAFSVGRVALVRGQVQRYNRRLQIVVRGAEAVSGDEVDDELFIRSSAIDPDLLWGRLMDMVEGVADKHLKQLLFRVFSDPEIADKFRLAPAARSMHHAFRSGLLEHTVSMANAARALARHYRLNEDLVVAGALLHDLGKIWELTIGQSIEYTDDGQLIGHLPMEVLFIQRQLDELKGFPPETGRQLLHILLSHHGEYAYGSPRRPKTPEAMVVYMADNLDSRIGAMLEAINQDGDSEEPWTPVCRILERAVYRRKAGGKAK